MPNFIPPIRDTMFAIVQVAGLHRVATLPGQEGLGTDLVVAQLAEAARLAGDVLAPLNVVGDREGCRLDGDGRVHAPPGFRAAYAQFVDGGWPAMPFDHVWGGQGLPWLVAGAAASVWGNANMAFALCPLLTQATAAALESYAAPRLKADYLPPLVAGRFTGTLAFNEPQAGSDLSAVRCRALPQGGFWALTGRKLPVSWGDHDLTENIIHLVLARTPDAKMPSLFLVPKRMPDGRGNAVRCLELSHTMGLHGSPTATIAYGDEAGGSAGWLVGEEGHGLDIAHSLSALLGLLTGQQGVAVAERAYQRACLHAMQRQQGTRPGHRSAALIEHPDVRRMLLSTKAEIDAARSLAYCAAAALDVSRHHGDDGQAFDAEARFRLLVPVVKGWGAEIGLRAASTALQVFGAQGYSEDSGVAQHMRDVRSVAILDGTTGLQALELITERVLGDGGRAMLALLAEMRATEGQLAERSPASASARLRPRLREGINALDKATAWVLERGNQAGTVAAAAMPFLRLTGTVAGGWLLARASLASETLVDQDSFAPEFLDAKRLTARFYAESILPQAAAFLADLRCGNRTLGLLSPDQF